MRLSEPGADLGVCLAVASALLDRPLPDDLVVCGEVGLGGELRQVAQTPRRLAEAARLGFRRAIVPASAPNGVERHRRSSGSNHWPMPSRAAGAGAAIRCGRFPRLAP